MRTIKTMMVVAALLAVFIMTTKGETTWYYADTITVPAGTTNLTTDLVTVYSRSDNIDYRILEEFLVKNSSGGGTGTVSLISSEIGIDTTISAAGAHNPGVSTVNYPLRAFTEQSMAGWVVTGSVAVAVEKTTVVTGYEKYKVRFLKVNITQPSNTTATVYDWSVKAK